MAHHLIYGGTFDPIHHGHLILCRRARELLRADAVILVPARVSPHKIGVQAMGQATGEQRLEMIRLAIAGEPDFLVDGRELLREGPSFTFDTISALAAEHGTAGAADRLTLLIGADQLAKLHTWHRVAELLSQVEIAVLPRPGIDLPAALRVVGEKLGESAANRPVILDTPLIQISASDIRQRAAAGLPVTYFVPAAVAEYIKSRNLYRAG